MILEKSEKVDSLLLIQSGKCNLNGFIHSRARGHMKVLIVSLLESSWYGDFQIFQDMESIFELMAAEGSDASLKSENLTQSVKQEFDRRTDKF